MSSGVPCLGYKSNNSDVMVATEEIIQDNQTGFLLSDYSIDSMANKVQWIYNQKRTQLKEMGKIARKKCLQEYNWSDFCNKILSFIQ